MMCLKLSKFNPSALFSYLCIRIRKKKRVELFLLQTKSLPRITHRFYYSEAHVHSKENDLT